MAHSSTILNQLTALFPRHEFESLAKTHHKGQKFRSFNRWSQFLAMHPLWMIGTQWMEGSAVIPRSEYVVEDHRVTRHVRLSDSHISSAHFAPVPHWGEVIVSSEAIPLVVTGSENGYRRIFFYFRMQDTDLPLRAEFPVLVQNAASWLKGSGPENLGMAIAGTEFEIAMSAQTEEAAWIREISDEPIPALKSGEALAPVQTVPVQPGLYRFVERDGAGQLVQSRWLYSEMDKAESNLEQTVDFTGLQHAVTIDGDESGGMVPFPLLQLLAILLLAVIVLEWGVYQRGTSV